MATEKNPPDPELEAPAELAPNMWFTEYGMPYTTLILEAEASTAKENPELATLPRSDLAQFMIDQETAVARDFHSGHITQEEFDAYKAKSEELLDASTEKIEVELDELMEDVEDWEGDFDIELNNLLTEHGGEITELVELSKTQELNSRDLSLDLMADTLGVVVNGADDLIERLPPHIHDVLDVAREESINNAHELLDARSDLSSAENHNLERDADRLDEIEPVFEADIDNAHDSIDREFEQIDQAFGEMQDYVEDAQQHAELNPGISAEYAPTRHVDDYDLPEQIEDETGVTDA